MMRFKQLSILLIFLFPTVTALAQWNNIGVETEDRNLSGFDQIVARGAADVYVKMGSKDEVLAELGSRVLTTVEDGVLIIKTPNWGNKKSKKKIRVDGGDIEDPRPRKFGSFFSRKNWSDNTPKVYVTIKQLSSISASGACDIYGKNRISAAYLTAKCSGASDMSMELDVDQLSCNLSGASDMKLTGKATTVSINASGASDFKSKTLMVQECNANASGSSDIYVNVEKKLSYRTSGASDIHYDGNPIVNNLKKGPKEIKPKP